MWTRLCQTSTAQTIKHIVAINTHPFVIHLLRGCLKVLCRAKEDPGFWTLTSSELLVCRGDRHVTNNHIQGDVIIVISIVGVASKKETLSDHVVGKLAQSWGCWKISQRPRGSVGVSQTRKGRNSMLRQGNSLGEQMYKGQPSS